VGASLAVLHLLGKIALTQRQQEDSEAPYSQAGSPKSLRSTLISQSPPTTIRQSVHTSVNELLEEDIGDSLELSAKPELSRSMIISMGRDQNILGKEEECLLRNLMENDRSNSLI
jgi:hypothetical protein